MQGNNQNDDEVKEITFVDVEKGKISNFFKKRMEQKGIKLDDDQGAKKVTQLLGINSIPSSHTLHHQTSQESHQKDPVREMVSKMLEDYEEVLTDEDLNAIPTGTRLKYITYDPEKKMELFRQGGYLRAVKPQCIVLAGLYKNVYNKRYRVNRQVYDPTNKANLLYNTRFFVKREDHPHSHSHLDHHPQVDVMRLHSAHPMGEPRMLMVGGGKEEDLDHSEDLIHQKSSSFERMSERILAKKQEELDQLNQRVNRLRERDQRRENYWA
jgi:hypothetical protein